MFRKLLLSLALVAALAGQALAQSAPPQVQISGTRYDAAGGVAVGTNWNTVNTQSVATTATPQAGQYVYVTAFYMAACQNATGIAATNVNWTETGLAASTAQAVAAYSAALTANSCAGSPGLVQFATPQKALSPATPVVLTSPAALTQTGFASEIFYYIAP